VRFLALLVQTVVPTKEARNTRNMPMEVSRQSRNNRKTQKTPRPARELQWSHPTPPARDSRSRRCCSARFSLAPYSPDKVSVHS
jgi:hypothetical protein